MFEYMIESCDVNDVLLVIQIQNQLLDSIDLPLLAHEQEIIVQVIQIIGVRNVELQKVTLLSFLCQLIDVALKLLWVLDPFEPTSQEVSTHCRIVQVICSQVLKVTNLFHRIEPIAHVLIVHLCIPMNYLSDATSSTSFKHQQHLRVS